MVVDLNTLISLLGILLTVVGFVALWAGVISKMRTQIDLLWEIYVTDALRKQRLAGVIENRSPEQLAPEVWLSVKEKLDLALIKKMRRLVAKHKPLLISNAALIVWYMEQMGFRTLSGRAAAVNMSLEEYLANTIVYLRELERGEDSLKETLGV